MREKYSDGPQNHEHHGGAVVYQEHPSFEAPADLDTPVWRYLSFTKLVSLLFRQELHFARADLLGDTFEGSFPSLNIVNRPDLYRAGGIPEDTLLDVIRTRELLNRNIGKFTFVNCWTALDHESVALWNLYSNIKQGVALRSTFRRLTTSLRADPRHIHAGLVQYIDYDSQTIPEGNTFNAFLYKRRSYNFENELRVVFQVLDTPHPVWLTGEGPRGIGVRVELNDLLERIHIAPAAEDWFAELVQTTADRFAPGLEVRRSAMKRDPLY